MIEVGRLCVKTAGRDAGLKCVVVEILENNMVLIDGQTRRRKCNMLHLEPLDQVIQIKSKASHDEIAEEFSKLQIEVKEKKAKETEPRPKKIRKKKVKPATETLSKKVDKAEKKAAKKEAKSKKEKAPAKEEPKDEKKE